MTSTDDELLAELMRGETLDPATWQRRRMTEISAEARDICLRINQESSDLTRIRELFEDLTGRPVPPTFRLFPPFTADFGRNIHVSENVFINSGCRFQDQGGIFVGAGSLIGHNVVIATLNHDLDPGRRAVMHPQSVHIGEKVWIGSGAILLPGVTVGDGAVVGAGSVVTRDVAPMTAVVGNPARKIKDIEEAGVGADDL